MRKGERKERHPREHREPGNRAVQHSEVSASGLTWLLGALETGSVLLPGGQVM